MEFHKLIPFIFLFALIPLVSSQNPTTYPSDTDIIISHSVRLNGGIFNGLCNITIFNPSKQIIIPFSNMSFNQANQTFNFVIQKQNITSLNKIYSYDVTCLSPSGNITESFNFLVTQDGTNATITEGFGYFFLLFVGISLFIYLIYSYKTMDTSPKVDEYGEFLKINRKKYLRMFLFAMIYIVATWIMFVSWNLAVVYINNRTIGAIFYTFHIGLLSIMWPFVVIWGLVTLITYVRDLNLEKKVQKGGFLQEYGK